MGTTKSKHEPMRKEKVAEPPSVSATRNADDELQSSVKGEKDTHRKRNMLDSSNNSQGEDQKRAKDSANEEQGDTRRREQRSQLDAEDKASEPLAQQVKLGAKRKAKDEKAE